MSIDDDYFDLEDAIKEGNFPDEWSGPVMRILDALTDQEKLTLALQDKIRVVESQTNAIIFDKAEATQQIKTLKKQVERLKKAS